MPAFISPVAAGSLTVAAGAEPDVQTIVYIHGIGNKPLGSILKCQWDSALFGTQLGDRSRMAYWVNREYYPTPSQETCASGDTVRIDDDEISTRAVRALAEKPPGTASTIESEIEALTGVDQQRKALRSLANKMMAKTELDPFLGLEDPLVRTRILPLPGFLRRLITERLTRALLRDVNDFLFRPERRKAMEDAFIQRLAGGGGPFIVVAHSQGTMIAYNVLRRLTKKQCDVRLFVTIGSPLGLTEVKDVLGKWGPLVVPSCVEAWLNVADRLDPVAADQDLSNDYSAGGGVSIVDRRVWNEDSPRHPHAATGYLRTSVVRQAVRQAAGQAFSQPTGRAVIIKDLVEQMEDSRAAARHDVLIQLVTPNTGSGSSLDEIRSDVIDKLNRLVGESGEAPESAQIDPTRRFIAAKLTRFEIERLRTEFRHLHVQRVWRNAVKRALICDSTNTIQARPANIGYSAVGKGIGWAILDTGIRGNHPHFETFENMRAQWDCTQDGKPPQKHEGRANLDKNGHGTHVAGIIAGSCMVPVKAGEPARLFAGMAPEAQLYGFKVLKDDGTGTDAYIIKALDLISDLNEKAGSLVIHGVNLSLGGSFDPSAYNNGHTPLCQELRRLWQQGVLVCLAAGNEGFAVLQAAAGNEVPANMDLTIGDPANLEEAIAVGSVHKTNPHTYGISFFSSRGPTADGRRKPDLVAPGEQILSAYHKTKAVGKPEDWKAGAYTAEDLYVEMSGTSMAAPHVSGLLAAFLSLRREFIGYPERVKAMLLQHCTDLDRDPYIQGRGIPNLIKMLIHT